MQITWNVQLCGDWCTLDTVDLQHPYFDRIAGVYLIWYGSDENRTIVRAGQGIIRKRLSALRSDPQIQQLQRDKGALYVSWAEVEFQDRDGIEAYLTEQCSPLIGEKFPDRQPIPVDLPWQAIRQKTS